MTKQEYKYLQDELSKLLRPERLNRKFFHSGYQDAYKTAVLDCKSKLNSLFECHNAEEKETE